MSSVHRSRLVVLFVMVASFHARAVALADEPVPPHQTFTMESALLKETRRINVYTPPEYNAKSKADTRYPVLYMLDGGLKEDFPHVATDVDVAMHAFELQPLILIGIENTERRRDMSGPTSVESDRKIAVHVGGSRAFLGFIENELMPEVRRRYRTTDERGLIGESLAGLFVVETFFQKPSLFSTYIALSPSLWWNNEALSRGAEAWLKTQPKLRAALYLASASDDTIGQAMARLTDALRKNAPPDLKWQYEFQPQLRHDNIYRNLSPHVLRKMYAPRK